MRPISSLQPCIPEDAVLNKHFSSRIKSLNLSDLSREDACQSFMIARCRSLSLCYAPLSRLNLDAGLILVGLTPGWSQMHLALVEAGRRLQEAEALSSRDIDEIHLKCYFAGTMRRNLVQMLDSVDVNNYLGLASTSALFGYHNQLMHATSVFKYPVFNQSENYTGYRPLPNASPLLLSIINNDFLHEISKFKCCLVIPLGKVASLCLNSISHAISGLRIIQGFPHPSSANGHRLKQLYANLDSLKGQVKGIK
jgi:hypothetical protein